MPTDFCTCRTRHCRSYHSCLRRSSFTTSQHVVRLSRPLFDQRRVLFTTWTESHNAGVRTQCHGLMLLQSEGRHLNPTQLGRIQEERLHIMAVLHGCVQVDAPWCHPPGLNDCFSLKKGDYPQSAIPKCHDFHRKKMEKGNSWSYAWDATGFQNL